MQAIFEMTSLYIPSFILNRFNFWADFLLARASKNESLHLYIVYIIPPKMSIGNKGKKRLLLFSEYAVYLLLKQQTLHSHGQT